MCYARIAVSGSGPGLEVGQVLRGHFVQERNVNGFRGPLHSEGDFVLAPGRGLIWRAEKPFSATTVITADGLVQDSGGTSAMRLLSTQLPFLSQLYGMFEGALGGDWQALDGDFVVTRTGDDRNWQVTLVPRKSDVIAMPIQSITLVGARFVNHVHIAKPDGDSEDLTFLDQTVSNTPLNAEDTVALASVRP